MSLDGALFSSHDVTWRALFPSQRATYLWNFILWTALCRSMFQSSERPLVAQKTKKILSGTRCGKKKKIEKAPKAALR